MDHQTRYRISFDMLDVSLLSLRRLIPIAIADRIETPQILHDLGQVVSAVIKEGPDKDVLTGSALIPIDLAHYQEIECSQAFNLHLLEIWMFEELVVSDTKFAGS